MSFKLSAVIALIGAINLAAVEIWTLQETLAFAAANNPDARIAQLRISAAGAILEQANAAFWPKAQVQSSYLRTDSPMMSFGNILNQRVFDSSLNFNNVPETDDINVRGVITAPIYAGGRSLAERGASRANRRASKLEKEALINELEFEVVRAFLAIRTTRELANSVEAAVRSFETNLVVARRRLENGSALKSEVLDIEVRLAEAREQLVRARNAGQIAGTALKNLIGLEADGPILIDELAPKLSVPNGTTAERPELRALREREEAAHFKVRSAKSGRLPRVEAFASVDCDYGAITGGDGRGYAAGVVARWDLWDGFSTRSKINEAVANLQTVQEEARKTRLSVDLQVEQARINHLAARERLLATEKAVSFAHESARISRDRFEQGLALATQLIDAETALLAARVRSEEAESDEQLAVASLRRALGLPQLEVNPGTK